MLEIVEIVKESCFFLSDLRPYLESLLTLGAHVFSMVVKENTLTLMVKDKQCTPLGSKMNSAHLELNNNRNRLAGPRANLRNLNHLKCAASRSQQCCFLQHWIEVNCPSSDGVQISDRAHKTRTRVVECFEQRVLPVNVLALTVAHLLGKKLIVVNPTSLVSPAELQQIVNNAALAAQSSELTILFVQISCTSLPPNSSKEKVISSANYDEDELRTD